MVQISINNVSFKVHKATNTVNVFVYNPNFAKGDTGSKTVRKALKFFWGTDYRLQTDIAFWDSAKQRFFEVYGSSDKVRGIPTQIYQRYMIDFP